MTSFGDIAAGSVLPIFFNTFASTGASVTITGLAVTDIEIYKGTSMTQRSSDAGYVLLDTDGTDIDGITGVHGFSIDTGDNTDAGFFAAGSFYTVIVSAVTADSQTVNFVAATFRVIAAENTAGVPVVDTVRVSNTTQTARDLGASVLLSSGTGTGQISLSSGLVDVTQTAADKVWSTAARVLTAGTNIVLPSNGLSSVTAWTVAITGNITGNLSGSVGSVTGAVGSVTGAVGSVASAITLPTIPADWITAAGIAASAGAEIADAVWDEATSGHVTAGTTGAAIIAAGSAGDPWSTSLPGAYGAGTAGYIVGTNLDTLVSGVPTATENADALLLRNFGALTVTNTRCALNALRFLRNKWSLAGTTLTVTEEDDTTVAWTAVVTTDSGATPITGSDPA